MKPADRLVAWITTWVIRPWVEFLGWLLLGAIVLWCFLKWV